MIHLHACGATARLWRGRRRSARASLGTGRLSLHIAGLRLHAVVLVNKGEGDRQYSRNHCEGRRVDVGCCYQYADRNGDGGQLGRLDRYARIIELEVLRLRAGGWRREATPAWSATMQERVVDAGHTQAPADCLASCDEWIRATIAGGGVASARTARSLRNLSTRAALLGMRRDDATMQPGPRALGLRDGLMLRWAAALLAAGLMVARLVGRDDAILSP
eukprot:CAMPEP_0117649630 /NCGR_PEP_ID=MMETSP0804-20121206/1080_1 /TAXON_ID=1074897 /ORGANISM="Tetraselmis astigmatica, Strain CCMP880" /LENGTH=218 /DNA_ID=CAMNT_0005455391 /DNA_START=228 /DNA_END=885 /DNA_ORIENTATION=-